MTDATRLEEAIEHRDRLNDLLNFKSFLEIGYGGPIVCQTSQPCLSG